MTHPTDLGEDSVFGDEIEAILSKTGCLVCGPKSGLGRLWLTDQILPSSVFVNPVFF